MSCTVAVAATVAAAATVTVAATVAVAATIAVAIADVAVALQCDKVRDLVFQTGNIQHHSKCRLCELARREKEKDLERERDRLRT